MEFVEILLLIITICVLILAVGVLVGGIMLLRYYGEIVQMQKKVDTVLDDAHREVIPTIKEVRGLFTGLKGLVDALTNLVSRYAFTTGVRKMFPKWGPRIAGYKAGLNIAYKIADNLSGAERSGEKESSENIEKEAEEDQKKDAE